MQTQPDEDGYIDIQIVKRVRLWMAVPDSERVTESDIRVFYSGPNVETYLALLEDPRCDIARPIPGRDLWMPCPHETFGGASRCKVHGGPGKQKGVSRLQALESENKRLRKALVSVRDLMSLREMVERLDPADFTASPNIALRMGAGDGVD